MKSKDNPHDSAAGAPGASGPGEPGYEGAVTIGEEGAVETPVGGDEVPEHVQEAWARADEQER